jgi:hypothetical protein
MPGFDEVRFLGAGSATITAFLFFDFLDGVGLRGIPRLEKGGFRGGCFSAMLEGLG